MTLVPARQMDGLSLHYYTVPTGRWGHKGSSTDFAEDQWFSTLRRALDLDGIVAKHIAIMDELDPDRRVGLVVDEWGTWYDPLPGSIDGFLLQQNSLRDALVAALHFHVFHRHARRVSMANIAQTVNVLQAMILTDKEKMLLTPTFHVFEMFKVHQGATSLPVSLETPDYGFADQAIPAVSASASRDAAGRVHLSLVATDPNRPVRLVCRLSGLTASSVTGSLLTAPAINSINTFDQPDLVRPVSFTGASLDPAGTTLAIDLPAKSVAVLELRP
jgi:alpha-N-arabinofuranosidase